MKISKALRRDKKLQKRQKGMQVDNKSIFEIQRIIRDKAIKAQREFKEIAYLKILNEIEGKENNEN